MTAISVFERGLGRATCVRLRRRRSESSGVSARSRSATGSARPEPTRRTRQFAPPTLEAVVVAGDPEDRAAAPRRARAARRAGSADQRPAGRHAARSSRSRSTARSRRRSSRRRWQTSSASRSHSARRRRSTSSGPSARRGDRDPARGIESVSRDDRAAHRAGARGLRHRVPARSVESQTVPLYLYKTLESFAERMGQYVRETLREGLFGWEVMDCVVTMTKCTYSVPDGLRQGGDRSARRPTSASSRRSSSCRRSSRPGRWSASRSSE